MNSLAQAMSTMGCCRPSLSASRSSPGGTVDCHMAEELQSVGRRRILTLLFRRCLDVGELGGQPNRVGNPSALDEREEIGDLKLAPARRTVALRNGFDAPFAVAVINNNQADRHIRGDHLPSCARIHELALEPGDLLRSEEIGSGA